MNCPEGHAVCCCTSSSQIIRGIFESHLISLSLAVLHAFFLYSPPLAPSFALETIAIIRWVYVFQTSGEYKYCLPQQWKMADSGHMRYWSADFAPLCIIHFYYIGWCCCTSLFCWISLTSIQQSTFCRNPLA